MLAAAYRKCCNILLWLFLTWVFLPVCVCTYCRRVPWKLHASLVIPDLKAPGLSACSWQLHPVCVCVCVCVCASSVSCVCVHARFFNILSVCVCVYVCVCARFFNSSEVSQVLSSMVIYDQPSKWITQSVYDLTIIACIAWRNQRTPSREPRSWPPSSMCLTVLFCYNTRQHGTCLGLAIIVYLHCIWPYV